MTDLLGEFECKLDSKFRLALPAGLKKQVPPEAQGRFVVNRGFEKHLNLFPFNEWQILCGQVESRLNLFQPKDRAFMRNFRRGASELSLDNAGRLLLPKRLLDYAGIFEEVILLAYSNRIECWDAELYDSVLDIAPDEFASLAEDVMGNKPKPEKDDRRPSYRDVPFIPPDQRH